MKKGGMFSAFLLCLVFLISFAASAESPTNASSTQGIDTKAYACLDSKVKDKCPSLSTEEKIFSLLTIERCKTELMSDSLSSECWPKSGCKIKTTSQAILALSHVNENTVNPENWLLEQVTSSTNLDWFLQVESEAESSCTAAYSGGSHKFTVNADKTLSGSAGNCLRVYNDYWFKIASTCYDEQFQISCDNSFLTSLLYQKKNSQTFYVSEKTDSAAAEGTTTEKINSFCFKEGNSCSYEGTLWAALVLKYRGHDISPYVPYLVALSDDNLKYIPYSFIYSLTNNFRTDLLALQQDSKYWSASGDKFYDTAVALLPFQNEQSLIEKENSKSWLKESQGTDGCWQGNIRNTAFLLYSIWPKKTTAPNATVKDCENSGYSCMSEAACTDSSGDVLADYTGCFGTNACCSQKEKLKTCTEQNGEICSSGQDCLGGSSVSSEDSAEGRCCIDGTCGIPQITECENNNGLCKNSCSSNEQASSFSCGSSSICCTIKPSSGGSLWIVFVLIILIALAVVGIIFRKKLQELLFRIKSKFGKGRGKPAAGGPRFPPTSSQRAYPGAIQRRIIPQARGPIPARRPLPQKKSEFDEVLKKLKEMGK